MRGRVRGRVPAAPQESSPQACTLLLLVLFVYDVFFVFITPFLTKVAPPPTPCTPRPSSTLYPTPLCTLHPSFLPNPCPFLHLAPHSDAAPCVRAGTASW